MEVYVLIPYSEITRNLSPCTLKKKKKMFVCYEHFLGELYTLPRLSAQVIIHWKNNSNNNQAKLKGNNDVRVVTGLQKKTTATQNYEKKHFTKLACTSTRSKNGTNYIITYHLNCKH